MPAFKMHPARRNEANILRACELPCTVRDAVKFHEEYGFLDYFCSDNATGRFVFCFVDLARYFNRTQINPCDIPAKDDKSGGPKWDMNWRDWIEKRGRGNIITVLADESIALPPQINIAFTTYELYICKRVLYGPDLPIPKPLRAPLKYELFVQRYPNFTTNAPRRNPNL